MLMMDIHNPYFVRSLSFIEPICIRMLFNLCIVQRVFFRAYGSLAYGFDRKPLDETPKVEKNKFRNIRIDSLRCNAWSEQRDQPL